LEFVLLLAKRLLYSDQRIELVGSTTEFIDLFSGHWRMSFPHLCLEGQMKVFLISQRKCQVWFEIARTNFVYSGRVQTWLVEVDSSAPYRLGSLCSLRYYSIHS